MSGYTSQHCGITIRKKLTWVFSSVWKFGHLIKSEIKVNWRNVTWKSFDHDESNLDSCRAHLLLPSVPSVQLVGNDRKKFGETRTSGLGFGLERPWGRTEAPGPVERFCGWINQRTWFRLKGNESGSFLGRLDQNFTIVKSITSILTFESLLLNQEHCI